MGLAKLNATQISEDPVLYSLREQDGSPHGDSFATLLEDCSELNKPEKLSSTTRQLLVGFRQLALQGQKKIPLKDQSVLVSNYSAKLDENRLELITYSLLKGECVYDLVLWEKQLPAESNTVSLGFLRNANSRVDKFAQAILTSVLE